MECPKCKKIIPDDSTACPHCHKVLMLVCPNCHSFSSQGVCEKCGYIILEKCAKCGKLTPTNNKKCKCGFSVEKSIAYNECENDEFAAVHINFGALKSIRSLLASRELYAKFLTKLKNLVSTQLKNIEGNVIIYGDSYVINFNKELSFPTSVAKAVRFSLKFLNAFTYLNLKIQDELGTPLRLTLTILKKNAEELLINKNIENNVKPLLINKNIRKELRGLQIVMDQYSHDCIANDYKTDSLYLIEHDRSSTMFYELCIDKYVLPPSENVDDSYIDIIKKETKIDDLSEAQTKDPHDLNLFDINAKCSFEKYFPDQLISNLNINKKIVSLKGNGEFQISTSELVNFYERNNLKVIYISCTEELTHKPWGLLCKIFKAYFNLSEASGLIDSNIDYKGFNSIKDLLTGKTVNSASPEDARYTYMELFGSFLNSIKNYAIIIDNFENIDNSSLQTFELYFDKLKEININFVFISDNLSLHSKIKGLLRTPLYMEVTIIPSRIGTLLSNIKYEADEFIQSFYYERIKNNFKGSKLYFDNAIQYLKDKGILINFENKLIVKDTKSVVLPSSFNSLIKARLKTFSQNQDCSMILAYSLFLGERMDFKILEMLDIKNIKENAQFLEKTGITYTKDGVIYINNYSTIRPIIHSSIKKEIQIVLAKTIIAKLGKYIDESLLASLMDIISMHKEEYLLLWKTSQIAISSGDYDAYLKNCLKSLSLIDKTDLNVEKDSIENHKKEIYQNILVSLYNYAPDKIYSLEQILLIDAIKSNDNEKIIKLSNLMLQGALLSSNYNNAPPLLNNILERFETPSLVVKNMINTKFLLLQLVYIEILFNTGEYKECIAIGEDILKIIKPEIVEKIKPASFSTNLFVSHLMDVMRLVCFAKLITNDSDFVLFFDKIKTALNEELPDKDCICALKDYIDGKDYTPSNIEEATQFSKVIFLILTELSNLKSNYKTFAQNIYQAKLLASDIHQVQLEYICDLLISYAYLKAGATEKANAIFKDILTKSEQSAIYNIKMLALYFMSKTKISENNIDDGLMLINDSLAELQKKDNQAVVFYAMFEKLYLETAPNSVQSIDILSEQKKLLSIAQDGELERIIRSADYKITPLEFAEEDDLKENLQEYHTHSDNSDILEIMAEDDSDNA